MTIDAIRQVIQENAAGNRCPVTAVTFLRKFPTTSRAILARCDDNREYVLKGAHNGRTLVSDHIVGRLGQLLGAPVGEVFFGVIPAGLKAIEPQLADVGVGICHATRWVPDCTDRQGLDHMDKLDNRERFARLQVLYSWTFARDHQLIYAKAAPYLVYSVDHGHFLHGSTAWSAKSLRQIGPIVLDPYFSACGLPDSVLADAKKYLAQVTDVDIHALAASPPDEWAITTDDRAALVHYLTIRRDKLLNLLP